MNICIIKLLGRNVRVVRSHRNGAPSVCIHDIAEAFEKKINNSSTLVTALLKYVSPKKRYSLPLNESSIGSCIEYIECASFFEYIVSVDDFKQYHNTVTLALSKLAEELVENIGTVFSHFEVPEKDYFSFLADLSGKELTRFTLEILYDEEANVYVGNCDPLHVTVEGNTIAELKIEAFEVALDLLDDDIDSKIFPYFEIKEVSGFSEELLEM